MTIGIIGSGSIGQRHVRCLKDLGYTDVIALRTYKGACKALPENLDHVREYRCEEDFFAEKPNGIIIANPTSLHVGALQRCLERDIPVLVEKPLSHTAKNLDMLRVCDLKKVIVGLCLRFHPIVSAIQTFLTEQQSTFVKARFYFGYYLPKWHPGIDYRQEYMGRRDLGGGILRTMSHEIDMMYVLLGPPAGVQGYVKKLSHLDIDVDDAVSLVFQYEHGGICHIELDYINPENAREGCLFLESGKLEYSFTPSQVIFTGYDGNQEVLFSEPEYDINDMYRAQMQDFIGFIASGHSENCTFQQGAELVRLIEFVEKLELFQEIV